MFSAAALSAACAGGGEPELPGVAEAKARAGREERAPGRVTALGRLQPLGEVIDIEAPPGDRLAELFVQEGQWVEGGQPLARLESYDERAAERNRVASQLAEARSTLAAETQFGRAEIAAAELALRELDELYPLEIEEVSGQVASLRAALENDRRELERLASLRERGAISPSEYERQQTLTRQRTESLRSAEARLRGLEDGREIRYEQQRARLQRATAALELAKTGTRVDSLGQELALAEARLRRAILIAPTAGRVLQIHRRPGESTGTGAILSMGDTEQMIALAEVYETDVRWVVEGQPARVSSPALPETLQGEVIFVGSAVGRNAILDPDPVADVDRRVVEVKVLLTDSSQAAHLVNLQVDVEIRTSDAED